MNDEAQNRVGATRTVLLDKKVDLEELIELGLVMAVQRGQCEKAAGLRSALRRLRAGKTLEDVLGPQWSAQ